MSRIKYGYGWNDPRGVFDPRGAFDFWYYELRYAFVEKNTVKVMPRKCKTVLLIYSQCNKDVLAAFKEEGNKFYK